MNKEEEYMEEEEIGYQMIRDEYNKYTPIIRSLIKYELTAICDTLHGNRFIGNKGEIKRINKIIKSIIRKITFLEDACGRRIEEMNYFLQKLVDLRIFLLYLLSKTE